MNRREWLLRTSGPQLDEDPWMTYQSTWLPLVFSDKYHLVADLTAGAGHRVPILDVSAWTDEDWNTVQEPSIAAMVAVWNAHFANGNYRWNRESSAGRTIRSLTRITAPWPESGHGLGGRFTSARAAKRAGGPRS